MSTLALMTMQRQRFKQLKPSENLLGAVGAHSSIELACTNFNSLKACLDSRKTSFSVPSLKQFEKQLSPQEIEQNWWREQSQPPPHMWLRPLRQTTGATPIGRRRQDLLPLAQKITGVQQLRCHSKKAKGPSISSTSENDAVSIISNGRLHSMATDRSSILCDEIVQIS